MTKTKMLKVGLATLLVVAIAGVLATVPVKPFLTGFLQHVESIGPWGPPLLAAVYSISCVLFVPGTILSLGAGFLFGVVLGTVVVSIGSIIGSTAAFVIGRTMLRDWIKRRIAAHPRFRAIDRAVGTQGFKIVLLTRLSPIFPFNFLNYAFGLTSVRLGHYVLASWIGMLPGTVMYVYFGSALKSLTGSVTGSLENGTLQRVLFVVGLVMTIFAAAVIARVAKQALDVAVAEHHDSVVSDLSCRQDGC